MKIIPLAAIAAPLLTALTAWAGTFMQTENYPLSDSRNAGLENLKGREFGIPAVKNSDGNLPVPVYVAAPDMRFVTEKGIPARINALRVQSIRRAEVWLQSDPAAFSFAPPEVLDIQQTLTCTYNEALTLRSRQGGGVVPKFYCDHEKMGSIRVKYSLPGKPSREVFAKIAASMLFRALGFGADPAFSVTVDCRNCPKDPWQFEVDGQGRYLPQRLMPQVVFPDSALELRFTGEEIAEKKDQGWSWKEIDDADPSLPLLKARRNALKLMAAFVQHGDNKSQQQRLVCRDPIAESDGEPYCPRPFMYIADLGATFGGAGNFTTGSSKMSFRNWAAKCVWKDPASLTARLNGSVSGTLSDPRISEEGRSFLAGLLKQLSPAQTLQLFTAARADVLSQQANGASAAQWAEAFRLKVREVDEKRCLDAERQALLGRQGP